MENIKYTTLLAAAFNAALKICKDLRHEFISPEHLLMAFLQQKQFGQALTTNGGSMENLGRELSNYLSNMEKVPKRIKAIPEASDQFNVMLSDSLMQLTASNGKLLDVPHVVMCMFNLNDSYAAYLLKKELNNESAEFFSELVSIYAEELQAEVANGGNGEAAPWKKFVTCLNDEVEKFKPLIGREEELERTIQVLCRKEKNNPLHVGEPGVGKTALVYGLTKRIAKGEVPERLKGAKVYSLEIGTLLAGTQFRGDFEKRIKQIMEGIEKEGNAIVYIDEIHNLVGAGRTSEGSMDASNMLKPYLEKGEIRFIGSTTYEEFNKYFSKSKGIVRRFQQIDIQEPSIEHTINIIKGLKRNYEKFHQVTYRPTAIEYAVRAAEKYISDRFLPDKAIDLIDEAGAYRETHPLPDVKKQYVDKKLIEDILIKMCKIDAAMLKEENNESLKSLQKNMLAKIYGQNEAVDKVTEAVQMAKAGLTDDNKPMASLLFVGPTGVGKTEVAKVLAKQLGIELVRFDMSEYIEKHAVAKLIGSPAGYVGYEDGGLLTDAIRKNPNCVLLLDEIEKAHEDIYNILLQVMDYARLTDNKGQHADFRNVILIMTSNAGAQHAAQASIGFGGGVSKGEAMMKQVKKTFKPEFMNRLSATVVFNDMDKKMATLILNKKLQELQEKLTSKKVTMEITEEVRQRLLQEGFTNEYGAREIERVISRRLKPILMKEILFGKLKRGGHIVIKELEDDSKA